MVDFWQGRFDVLVSTTIVDRASTCPRSIRCSGPRGTPRSGQCTNCAGASVEVASAPTPISSTRRSGPVETAYDACRTIVQHRARQCFRSQRRPLEIPRAGNLLGHDQSGSVAAVGYELYVNWWPKLSRREGLRVVPRSWRSISTCPASAPAQGLRGSDDARLEAYPPTGGRDDV